MLEVLKVLFIRIKMDQNRTHPQLPSFTQRAFREKSTHLHDKSAQPSLVPKSSSLLGIFHLYMDSDVSSYLFQDIVTRNRQADLVDKLSQ